MPDLKVIIDDKRYPDIIRNVNKLREMASSDVSFYSESGRLIGKWKSVVFPVDDLCNILTVKEIFIKKLYEFENNKKMVVVDIGMNVGYATIFFTENPNVQRVYGYEPFAFTFAKALDTFSMNPKKKAMIVPIQIGVSNSSRELKTTFNCQDHTSMGVGGLVQEHNPDKKFDVEETINLIDVVEVLKMVKMENPDAEIIVKMDCEGSEYEILDRLEQSNMIDWVEHYCIEWHILGDGQDPNRLKKILLANGYFLNLAEEGAKIGMIFATRLKGV